MNIVKDECDNWKDFLAPIQDLRTAHAHLYLFIVG